MKDLNKEAEEYAKNQKFEGFDSQMRRETFTRSSLNEAYIAGANSKYVKQQILIAQIELINTLNLENHTDVFWILENRRLDLILQLKQLQND